MSSEEYPSSGSQWRHHSGRLFTVLYTVNIASISPRYPTTVVYIGRNGHFWSKTLINFRETMTSVLNGVGESKLNDLLAELKVHVTMLQCNPNKPDLIRERTAELVGIIGELSSTGVIGLITPLVETLANTVHELRSELEGKSDAADEVIFQLKQEIEQLKHPMLVHREDDDNAEHELLQNRVAADNERKLKELTEGLHKLQLEVVQTKKHNHIMV